MIRYQLTWSQCRKNDRKSMLPGFLCILGFIFVELIERGSL